MIKQIQIDDRRKQNVSVNFIGTESAANEITIDVNKSGHTLILLDSNIHIKKNNKHLRMITTLAGKMKKYKASLIMPNIVLYEVSKVSKTSKQETIDKISSIFHKITILEENNEIRAEAKRLETQFLECHSADSVILATAKIMDAVLVTADRKLLRTARIEGVRVYGVKDFLKNWRLF